MRGFVPADAEAESQSGLSAGLNDPDLKGANTGAENDAAKSRKMPRRFDAQDHLHRATDLRTKIATLEEKVRTFEEILKTSPDNRMGQTDGNPDRRFFADLPNSPFGTELTLAFARELIVNEDVGTDATPDMLFLGLSSADYVGHEYGPYSREVQDYYLQLDGYLGEFFAFLDEHVGAGRYLVALSADHGVLPIPEELTRRGIEAGRHDFRPLIREIRQVGQAAAEAGELPAPPELVFTGGIALRFSDATPTSAQSAAFRHRLAELIRSEPDIAQAYTYDELLDGAGSGKMFGRHLRSFHPDRSADVIVELIENYLTGATPRGTSHGSAWDYDTNVPLIFAGPGIIPGEHGEYTRTVDMAPTLARLLGITPPDALDGRVLTVGLSFAGTPR